MHEHLNSSKTVFDKMTMKSKRVFIKWTQEMASRDAQLEKKAVSIGMSNHGVSCTNSQTCLVQEDAATTTPKRTMAALPDA